MGISWSSNRRRNSNYYHNPYHRPHPHNPYHHPHPHFIASSSSSSSYSYPSESYPYPAPTPYAYPAHPPPPPPVPPICPSHYHYGGYSACNDANHAINRANVGPYYPYPSNTWAPVRPATVTNLQPPAYVDHQEAKKVRNDVNVHKDSLRLLADSQNPDHYLVSFVFDALFDGSFTVLYFAREESGCRFVPLFPEIYMPLKFPFQKGIGQRFCQPTGTGIDLGFFELDDLSRPSSGEDAFPLVISAETCLNSVPVEGYFGGSLPNSFPHVQITQAVIEKNDENAFHVRVMKQILWIDGVRYELREIYGIGNSAAETFRDDDPGKECVICLTEPKDTAVLPCRHMCMCSECAKTLRIQSNKCPICRQPIEKLIEIKINSVDQ